MKYICKASCDDEYLENYDYLYLEITPEDARRYLRYRDAHAAAKAITGSLYCIEVFDYSCQAFREYDELEDVFESNNLADWDEKIYEAPEDYEVPDDMCERTDCDCCRVLDTGIKFTMFPKFMNTLVSSPTFTWERLEELAAGSTKEFECHCQDGCDTCWERWDKDNGK